MTSFNEAVGYYRRNRRLLGEDGKGHRRGFNEAVGYYRRNHGIPARPASARPAALCFNEAVGYYRRNPRAKRTWCRRAKRPCFNEAVGYYRRNHEDDHVSNAPDQEASMRPSDITDGIPIFARGSVSTSRFALQ